MEELKCKNEQLFELPNISQNYWFEIILRSQERPGMKDGGRCEIWLWFLHYRNTLRLQGLLIQLNLSSVLAGSQNLEYIVVSWMNIENQEKKTLFWKDKISIKRNHGGKKCSCFDTNVKHENFNCISAINDSLSK